MLLLRHVKERTFEKLVPVSVRQFGEGASLDALDLNCRDRPLKRFHLV